MQWVHIGIGIVRNVILQILIVIDKNRICVAANIINGFSVSHLPMEREEGLRTF